jgi:DNA repair protein RadC
LAGGMSFLSDADLVAILLGPRGTGESALLVAAELLEGWGGLQGISRLGPARLASQAGVGSIKAMRLLSAFELGWRAMERASQPKERVRTPAAVADWFGVRIGALDHEEMWVLSLDGLNGLVGARRVAQGPRHGCSVTARDILRAALVDGACAVALVHNHPGGDPSPSCQDIEMTKGVAEAAAVVGVPLMDHVIVTGSGKYVSLRDLGVFAI